MNQTWPYYTLSPGLWMPYQEHPPWCFFNFYAWFVLKFDHGWCNPRLLARVWLVSSLLSVTPSPLTLFPVSLNATFITSLKKKKYSQLNWLLSPPLFAASGTFCPSSSDGKVTLLGLRPPCHPFSFDYVAFCLFSCYQQSESFIPGSRD